MVLEKDVKVKLLKLQVEKGRSVAKAQQAFKVFYKSSIQTSSSKQNSKK